MKLALIFSIMLCSLFCSGKAQNRQALTYFHLEDVRLLESPFLQAQQTDLKYIMAMNPDRLLAPYLREAGLTPKAPSYTNWENTGLDGHIGGHYLSALSLMYASTGNTDLLKRLDYMLHELHRAQKQIGTGFLGGTPGSLQLWAEIKQGNIRAGGFDLNGKWVPLYNIHKTYAGLRDAYLYAHSDLAKNMLTALCDWMIQVTQNLSDEQIQDMLRSEHGGLNEIFADVAEITGEEKYLTLAKRFSHQSILNPLLNKEDKLTGLHANTQIPKVIGFKRIADLTGNYEWLQAARFFWNTVVEHRTVCIGGNSVREHFHPSHDFSPMLQDVQGPETCNTYNMLRLTKMLYQNTPEVKLADYYERALYNHILSSQHPEKGGFVYFTPIRSGHYRVYSQPETSMWCCVGSGLENHAKYGEFIYAQKSDTLYVNLFIPSKLNWKEKGISICQNTRFPDEDIVRIQITQCKHKEFTIKLRCPQWTSNALVSINGKPVKWQAGQDKYIAIHRKWKAGDEITLQLPMKISLEPLPDQQPYYAFMYGPIALASPMGKEHLDGLFADDSRGGHIAHGKQIPLLNMPILSGTPAELQQAVQKEKVKDLSFSYLGNVYPFRKEPLKLIPFFRLHDERYALYFRQADSAEIKNIQKATEEAELRTSQLANQTVDLIFPGEQQPESDHHIQYHDAETGILYDRHFRRAKGWFSYELNNKGNGHTLYIMVNKQDSGQMKVLLNGKELIRKNLPCEIQDNRFSTYVYPLTQTMNTEKQVLKFIPDGTDKTPAIFEIRVLK